MHFEKNILETQHNLSCFDLHQSAIPVFRHGQMNCTKRKNKLQFNLTALNKTYVI